MKLRKMKSPMMAACGALDKAGASVLSTDPASQAFSPGHNGFFKSPDGREDWISDHANPAPGEGCGNARSLRIQRFTWNADGTPHFGWPVPLGVALAKPSGL